MYNTFTTFSIFKLQYSFGTQICISGKLILYLLSSKTDFVLPLHCSLSRQPFINLYMLHWNFYLVDFILFFNFCNNQNIKNFKKKYRCICFTIYEVWRTSGIYIWCINQSWQHMVYITAYQSLLSNLQLFPAYLSTFLWRSNLVEVIH